MGGPSGDPSGSGGGATAPPSRCASTFVAGQGGVEGYVVAGEAVARGGASTRLGDVWELGVGTDCHWTELKASTVYGEEDLIGLPRSNHACAAWGEVLLIVGGWAKQGLEPLSALALFHTATACWTKGSTTGPAPTARGNPTLVIHSCQSKAVLFGGWNGNERLNDLYVLDLITWEWQVLDLPNPPCRRTDHSAIAWDDGGAMVVFGGSSSAGPLSDVYALHWRSPDLVNWRWEKVECSGVGPAGRTSHAACLAGSSCMAVTGGQSQNQGQHSSALLQDSWWLDLTSMAWSQAPSLPYSMCRHSVVHLKGCLYLFGGYDGCQSSSVLLCLRPAHREGEEGGTEVEAEAESDIPGVRSPPAVANIDSWARVNPLTLAQLQAHPSTKVLECLEEIEELPDEERPKELYLLLHREAVERGYEQYVDPASGYTVFTALYLKQRQCCGNKCRHCPWKHVNVGKPKDSSSLLLPSLDW
ncbi:unnamed protein product [Chrysoparadoxa australica]